MEKNRELFIKAFMEAESYDYSKLKSEEEINWEFSERFEKSMNKLIQKNNRIALSTRQKIRKGLIASIIAVFPESFSPIKILIPFLKGTTKCGESNSIVPSFLLNFLKFQSFSSDRYICRIIYFLQK